MGTGAVGRQGAHVKPVSDIRRFIDRELLDGGRVVGDPLENGALDSLSLEQLIAFVEEHFGVVFADEDLTGDGFRSTAALGELVQRKLERDS